MASTSASSSTAHAAAESPKQTTATPTSSSPPTSLTFLSADSSPPPTHALHETLPSEQAQRQITEARAAVVATIANLVDSELQSRATVLHDNAAALDKQEKDVASATEGLRKESEKLANEASLAARQLKEVGNVQNWAEVLERQFVVLEETVRLANGGDTDSESGSGSGSECSCSDCGREENDEMDVDEAGGASAVLERRADGLEEAIQDAITQDIA